MHMYPTPLKIDCHLEWFAIELIKRVPYVAGLWLKKELLVSSWDQYNESLLHQEVKYYKPLPNNPLSSMFGL